MLLNERKEQDSVITSLRSKLNERDEQAIVVSTLRHERKEQDAIISSLKHERDEKDKVITTLHDQNNHMVKEIQRLEADLRTKQNETEKMASAISGSDAAAKLSQSQNAEIEKAMAEMKSKNEDLRADVENMAKQRDMVLDRYKNLVERFDALQRSTDAEKSQPKEDQTTEPTPNQAPDQGQKSNETLHGPENEFQDEDDIDDTADITMRPTMEPQLALKQIMSNVHNQIEQLTAQHSAKSAELRALDKSKNLRLRRSIAESLKMLVDQISSHSDFLYRLKDVSYAF
ncbi:hypothetical protein DID88_004057 [Monilinia fructigena]|uniref:Cep57 centrosome microtubule-binding domain-containing protein n=1 Tax=Monilinia fructigena TaxID=38457 RepID=A0A395IRP1_9HELO|nr:hypothetical protein DID88_004057 [Monilinia fructigena]